MEIKHETMLADHFIGLKTQRVRCSCTWWWKIYCKHLQTRLAQLFFLVLPPKMSLNQTAELNESPCRLQATLPSLSRNVSLISGSYLGGSTLMPSVTVSVMWTNNWSWSTSQLLQTHGRKVWPPPVSTYHQPNQPEAIHLMLVLGSDVDDVVALTQFESVNSTGNCFLSWIIKSNFCAFLRDVCQLSWIVAWNLLTYWITLFSASCSPAQLKWSSRCLVAFNFSIWSHCLWLCFFLVFPALDVVYEDHNSF